MAMTSVCPLLKVRFLTLFILLPVMMSGQNPYALSAGAREASMAYADIASAGFWSSFHNQALLGYYKNFTLAMSHESRFGIAELSNKTFGLIIPSGHGSIGAAYSYYGYSDFNRHTAALAYGMMIGENITAGVQADLYSTRQWGNYSNYNEITFEAGLTWQPADPLTLAFHLYNPLPPPVRPENIPTVISTGLSYRFSERFMAAFEYAAGSNQINSLKAGCEGQVLDLLFLRGGLMTEPFGYSFGAGYRSRLFQADLSFITHENLGLTPSVSLLVNIK
ncbi:MAG: hypothetical protein LC649_06160 [Bacteroidales bacterium]|nr:hypothetical protein [Bacteroidales bacterium]